MDEVIYRMFVAADGSLRYITAQEEDFVYSYKILDWTIWGLHVDNDLLLYFSGGHGPAKQYRNKVDFSKAEII